MFIVDDTIHDVRPEDIPKNPGGTLVILTDTTWSTECKVLTTFERLNRLIGAPCGKPKKMEMFLKGYLQGVTSQIDRLGALAGLMNLRETVYVFSCRTYKELDKLPGVQVIHPYDPKDQAISEDDDSE